MPSYANCIYDIIWYIVHICMPWHIQWYMPLKPTCTHHMYTSHVHTTCTHHMYTSHVHITCTHHMSQFQQVLVSTTTMFLDLLPVSNNRRHSASTPEVHWPICCPRSSFTHLPISIRPYKAVSMTMTSSPQQRPRNVSDWQYSRASEKYKRPMNCGCYCVGSTIW